MPTQYLTNKAGKKVSVVIPMKDYKKMMEEIDELNCIKAYDKSKAARLEFIPAKSAFKEIERRRKVK